jgi:hypothetical protein
MIKIRYRDPNELSPGLHAEAERHGRMTTVYLLTGLTAAERRAALRRLRISARMGYGPALPLVPLALALFADRIMTGVAHAGAVFRLHPAGSTVPVMVLSAGAVAFLLFSTVSIHVLPEPRAPDQAPASGASGASGAAPVASAHATPGPAGSRAPAPGGDGRAGQPGQSGETGQTGSASGPPSRGQTGLAGATSPAVSRTGRTTGSTVGGGTPLGGSSESAQTADPPAPATTPAPAVAPSPSAAALPPSPTATAHSGICIDIGPLGICLG